MVLFLFLALALTLSVTGRAQNGPGVWDQLQHQGERTFDARIEKLEISTRSIVVGYREMVDDGGKFEIILCSESVADHSQHEGWLSAVNNQRIETLRQAFKSRETVRISVRGPWSPCLSSISMVK